MSKRPLYKIIASLIGAIRNCEESGNTEWLDKHTERLEWIARNKLPSGSGIDRGTRIDTKASAPDRVFLMTAFHHMDDAGSYDGWTEHTITITPSLAFDFLLKVSGRDRNDVKEYLVQLYQNALIEEFSLADIPEEPATCPF